MRVLVAYDGTLDARAALKYGIGQVREHGGNLVVFSVFPVHLFIDYDAGPKAQEVARQESFARVNEALEIIRAHGRDVRAHIFTVDGSAEDEMLRYAGERSVDLSIFPPSLESIAGKAVCLTDIVSADEDDTGELFQGRAVFEEPAEARLWRSH